MSISHPPIHILMKNNEIIESFFNGSDWNSIVQNSELVKGYILTIGKLF